MFKKKIANNKNRSSWWILVVITIVYLGYSFFIIKPHTFKNFSLIDDPIVLLETSGFYRNCVNNNGCSDYLEQIFETGSRRFRPSYWIINTALIEIMGDNPQTHHLFRVYFIGLLCILLLGILIKDAGGGIISIILGTSIFTTNFSFSENIIRLGTNEPFQVLFLAIFSLVYLNKEFIMNRFKLQKLFYSFLLVMILIWTLLIKESSFAILPTVFLIEVIKHKNNYRLYSKEILIIPLLVFIGGIFISKGFGKNAFSSFTDYTANYSLKPSLIFSKAAAAVRNLLNSTSPFIKVSAVLIPLISVNKNLRLKLFNNKFIYWCLFTLFFTIVLFPWKFVLERYQLMAVFGISIVTAIVIEKFILYHWLLIQQKSKNKLLNRVYIGLAILILINLFFRGFPINLARTINYSTWFSIFTKFESEQVLAIGRQSTKNVYINGTRDLDNLEILYGIPLQLRYLYDSSQKVEVVEKVIPEDGYIFSRSSLVSEVSLEDLGEMLPDKIESQSYYAEQIAPLLFRDYFQLRPLQTFFDPPLKDEGLSYYWEIRDINN